MEPEETESFPDSDPADGTDAVVVVPRLLVALDTVKVVVIVVVVVSIVDVATTVVVVSGGGFGLAVVLVGFFLSSFGVAAARATKV